MAKKQTKKQQPIPGVKLGPGLTEEQAKAIFAKGEDAVVFAMLKLASMAKGDADHPSTPSAMKPTYKKPVAKPGRKKPGRKTGHPGTRRAKPDRIDRRKSHRAET